MSPLHTIPNTPLNLPPNVQVEFSRIDRFRPLDRITLAKTVKEILCAEAKAHGADFNEEGYPAVLKAVNEKKLQAHILTVSYKEPEAISFVEEIAGVMITLPTVHSKWNAAARNFINKPALYFEDTFVLKKVSHTFRKLTASPTLPEGIGLGTLFHAKMLSLSMSETSNGNQFGFISSCYVAEHGEDNKPITTIYKRFNATQEENEITGVMLFEKKPTYKNKTNIKIAVNTLATKHVNGNPMIDDTPHISHNIFTTSWSDNTKRKHIQASFTESLSTFNGTPVIRIQITSNGELPTTKKLNDVLNGMIYAGLEEASKRNWTVSGANHKHLRIHALNEPEIIESLIEIGAKRRILGDCPMKPVVIEYKDLPHDIFGAYQPDTCPFQTYKTEFFKKTGPTPPSNTNIKDSNAKDFNGNQRSPIPA